MARVVVTFAADGAERARVEDALEGHDVLFLADGATVEWEAVDALLVFSFRDVPDEAFGRLRRLAVVQTMTAGTDHVPRARLPAGVAVHGAAGENADAVAEHALALLLAAAKRVVPRTRAMRAGRFEQTDDTLVLSDATVVVLGTGHVGRAVARRLRPFGCRLVGINRSGTKTPGFDQTLQVAGLDEAFGACDVLVVALPLTPQTAGLVDARRLALLRPHAVIVNVARGGIVDEDALLDHLRRRPGSAAALDVWWAYPDKATGEWRPPCRRGTRATSRPRAAS